MDNTIVCRLVYKPTVLILIVILSSFCSSKALRSQEPQVIVVNKLPLGLPALPKGSFFQKSYVDFGAKLFFERELSNTQDISCASCHVPNRYFSNNKNKVQRNLMREIPSLFNLAYNTRYMWDGATNSIETQALLPLQNKCEMDVDWPRALTTITTKNYSRKFLTTIAPRKIITKADISISLGSFMKSLVSGDSRFDQFMYGSDTNALSKIEKTGFKLFSGKAKCAECHTVNYKFSLFTDNGFHAIGVGLFDGRYIDKGRGNITSKISDMGAFKTPSLRNIQHTAPYMHDGSQRTLLDVINFYNKGQIHKIGNVDKKMIPLKLTDQEKDALISFLKTLDATIVSYQPWN